MTFEETLASLLSLSRTQLEEIRRRCAFLLQNKSSDSNESLEESDWLLSGILSELERLGIDSRKASSFRIRKSSSFASYSTKSAEVRQLLEKAAPGLSVTEQKLLGEIAAQELARYLKVEISLANLLNFVRLVPQALSHAFPGYIEAGMLSVVVRKKL